MKNSDIYFLAIFCGLAGLVSFVLFIHQTPSSPRMNLSSKVPTVVIHDSLKTPRYIIHRYWAEYIVVDTLR